MKILLLSAGNDKGVIIIDDNGFQCKIVHKFARIGTFIFRGSKVIWNKFLTIDDLNSQ